MLATREARDDVVPADLPRGDPQGRDLDHDVGPGAADVLGRPSVDPAATGLQGGARVREPQRLPQVDPSCAFHAPMSAGDDPNDRGIEARDLRELRPTSQSEPRTPPA